MTAPTEKARITPLSSMTESLHSADGQVTAEAFRRIADEALVLCESAPTQQLWNFWGALHERCYHEARVLLNPPEPKPKRRWFR
jgi:hypothetical protein